MLDQLYGTLFRHVAFPVLEGRARGRATFDRLRFLEDSQWRPLDELRAFQLGELRRLLENAYDGVPYYRRRFDEYGVRPRDVQSLADLHRLPLLTRDDARQFADERKATRGPRPEIMKATGGTTGQPLLFGYERASEYWRQAAKWRGYGWAGFRPGDRSLHFWGASTAKLSQKTKWKIAIDRTMRRESYYDCHARSAAELQRVVDAIVRERPTVMLCYTQAGVDLARYVVENHLRQWETLPVLCGAERLMPQDRPVMEQAFGPAVFETYGSREVMLMGAECEKHAGFHQTMENLVVEILVRDGDRTRHAKPGERGEVAITDLHNQAMPFIRYLNGDLAVAGSEERCACGRGLLRFGPVEGRVADTLRDGQGGKVNGLVFNVIFTNYSAVVRQFQAVQHGSGDITLKVVLARAFTSAERADVEKHIAKYLPGVKTTLVPVDDLPPGQNGKRRVVITE